MEYSFPVGVLCIAKSHFKFQLYSMTQTLELFLKEIITQRQKVERQLPIALGWVGELLFNIEFQFTKWKSSGDGGDGCTILNIINTTELYT